MRNDTTSDNWSEREGERTLLNLESKARVTDPLGKI